MERIIERTEDGSATLFVPELNEHYHSVKGARTESQHIFIDMGLKASAAIRPRIELYPLSWEEVDVLNYSNHPLFKELHTAPWDTDVNITPYFTLHKIQGDVNKVISGERLGISVERLEISDKSPINHSSLIANH